MANDHAVRELMFQAGLDAIRGGASLDEAKAIANGEASSEIEKTRGAYCRMASEIYLRRRREVADRQSHGVSPQEPGPDDL